MNFNQFLEWINEEIIFLITGRKLFKNDWKKIKNKFNSKFNNKSTTQLKDKWRSISSKVKKNKVYFENANEV